MEIQTCDTVEALVIRFPSEVYGAHFYVSMKGRAILGPPFGAPQIEQYICLPIGSCLVEDRGAVAKQRLEEHLLQERGAIA